jgi:hypothetical protein
MTRREAWLTAGAIFALALVVRAVAAAAIAFPVPEYTAYYFGVARNIAEGRGLVTDAIWSYQLPPLTFPRPAFEIWLPLPSLLAAPFMAVLGTGLRGAQVSSVLVSSIVPVLAWRLATDLAAERGLPMVRARALALGAGVVASLYGPLAIFGAQPDSTAPFTVFALASCVLMERIARDPAGGRASDLRLMGLGATLGLAALTRNEAIWYAAAWVLVATSVARSMDAGTRVRAGVRLVGAPALLAIAIYAPWAARQWATFGTPLPGQAVTNAFSRTGSDIFAWSDRPSFTTWLAQGPAKLLSDRVAAFWNDLVSVLLLPAIPVGPVGIIGLPWVLRSQVLRPLLLGSALTFLATTLVFPVATQSGTFLHAAGPVHVLLVISAVAVADMLVAAIGARRRWRPSSAAIGPAVLAALAVPPLLLAASVYAAMATTAEQRYADLLASTDAAGVPLAQNAPVISDYPIWLAETARVPTLALPDETPESVLDLARTFGARLLVVSTDSGRGRWPGVLDAGGAAAACFVPVPAATVPSDSSEVRVYRIACP